MAVAASVTQYQGERMPLKSGRSRKTIAENISELHSGQTFARTKRKFGRRRAQKQAVAIALEKARGPKPRRKTIAEK
jgi:hypothetical protein